MEGQGVDARLQGQVPLVPPRGKSSPCPTRLAPIRQRASPTGSGFQIARRQRRPHRQRQETRRVPRRPQAGLPGPGQTAAVPPLGRLSPRIGPQRVHRGQGT